MKSSAAAPASNPVETLAIYIRDGNNAKFFELFELLHEKQSLLNINLHQLVSNISKVGDTLHELAVLHNRKEIFEYLMKASFSEKDYLKRGGSLYIKALAAFLKNENDTADFQYWVDMLAHHRDSLLFNINEAHDGLSLLQIACLQKHAQLQKLIDGDILQKLIDLGAKPNIQFAENDPHNDDRRASMIVLLAIPSVQLSPAIMESLLIAYTRLGEREMVRQFLVKIIGQDLEAIEAQGFTTASLMAEHNQKVHRAKELAKLKDKGEIVIGEIGVKPNINATDSVARSAISYAAELNDLETVKLLLKYGASPLNAVNYAISKRLAPMTRLLLQHGGGIFSDLDFRFQWMNVNINDCYVEGMKVEGKPVNKQTPGFHFALHDAESLLAYKEVQDKLAPGYRNFIQPLSSIKNALAHLDENIEMADNRAFNKACEVIFSMNNVSSLKFMSKNVLLTHADNLEYSYNEVSLPLQTYVENINPRLAAAVFDLHPDKQNALAILNDRVDELSALHAHMRKLLDDDASMRRPLARLAATSCHSTYTLPLVYGFYSLFAFCGDSLCHCCGVPATHRVCEAAFISKYAMYFFGIPGFVVLGVVGAGIAVMMAYRSMYGDDFDKPGEPTTNQFTVIQDALNTLQQVLKHEELPHQVRQALQRIGGENLKFSDAIAALIVIRNYYQDTEIKLVQQGVSQNSYHSYQSDLFFWNNEQRQANRNNKLPRRLRMDEEGGDLQHGLGYQLFTIMDEGSITDLDELPRSITMSDGDIQDDHPASKPNERTPLMQAK